MDANGTRFHLLLDGDWLRRTSAGLLPLSPPASGDERGAVRFDDRRKEIALAQLPFEFPVLPGNRHPSLDDRRGAAGDRYGNFYWIDETSTALLVRSTGSRETSLFWQTGQVTACSREPLPGGFRPAIATEPTPAPLLLRGLAITEDHHLVAGIADPPGLLVFDLHAGGAPSQLCWPGGTTLFAPFDMTARKGGGVWVLDRDHARIWGFDRHFGVIRRDLLPAAGVVPETFGPRDEGPAAGVAVACRTDAIRASDAWSTVADAIAIEAYPPDGLIVLTLPQSGSASNLYYRASIDEVEVVLDPQFPRLLRGQDVAVAYGTQREPEEAPALRIFVVAEDGNQSIAYTLDVTDPAAPAVSQPLPEYYPMRLYGGKGLAAAGRDAFYDFGDAWIPLVEQRRPRYVTAGTVSVNTLDGKQPDCVWHRLLLDGCIPPDTGVDVYTRAANERFALELVPWHKEPTPYRRHSGSELPYLRGSSDPSKGTWELLFQQAKGRYLDLKIALRGNGRSSPRVRAVRAYYPRFSYLERYLPGVYREEQEPASLLDRLLANMEGMLTTVEDRIAAAQVLLDVRTAPAEALDWLASWFDAALDPLWSEPKRRLFIAHAMDFFARRGTVHGLQLALALTAFNCDSDELFDERPGRSPASRIRILERFLTRVPPHGSWAPAQGRDTLRSRYDAVLQAQSVAVPVAGPFPLAPPSAAAEAAVWRQFTLDALGFLPSIVSIDAARWREFLARRYHSVAGYNEVYRLTGHAPVARFDEIDPPRQVPPDGAPLVDWHEFETLVLPAGDTAHQFTVLLPVDRGTQADSADHERLRQLAARVVALEKPAHTVFDIRFYWALFRVGEVRLGPDAVIGLGSRAPDVLLPMVLDRGHLAENYLAPSHPRNVTDRKPVVGRDRPGCGCC